MSTASSALEVKIGSGARKLSTESKDGKQKRRVVFSVSRRKKMRRGQNNAQEQPGVARKICVKWSYSFLSEVIAESMWRAMVWACDERPYVVINTLKQVLRLRSTKWWQSTQASGMKSDPDNHTRWKHKCGWHNRGCVSNKLATEWSGKKDWTSKRAICHAFEDKKRFATFRVG